VPRARDVGVADYDFTRIRSRRFDDRFTPAVSQMLFTESVAWLETCFARSHGRSHRRHHAPCTGGAAASQGDSQLRRSTQVSFRTCRPPSRAGSRPLWLHGHTHDSFDYRIGATRVVWHPAAYVRNGVREIAVRSVAGARDLKDDFTKGAETPKPDMDRFANDYGSGSARKRTVA